MPPSCASWTSGPGAPCAPHVAAIAAGLRALGVGEGDRVAAYMPNIPETVAAFLACASIGAVWSSAAPEFGARSVIDRFAQIEPKVLLAVDGYRYGGKDFDRRAIVAQIAAEVPSLQRDRGARLPRRNRMGGRLLGRGIGALVRTVAVRPPAVGAVQLGHDRAAEADRPRPGRDPDRAAQEDASAPRRPGRGPRLLVFDDRLDDVELPRRRAADRRVDRAVRRQPRIPRPGSAVGSRRAHAHDLLRDQRGVHRGLHEGLGRAGRGPGSQRAARSRLDGLTARPRGLPLDLRPARRGHVAVLDLRRDRPVHGLRRRRADAARVSGRAPGAFARRQRRGLGSVGAAAGRRGRRAGDHRADAVDADLLLGR